MRKEYCKSVKKILKIFNYECWSIFSDYSGQQMKDIIGKYEVINDRLYYL